MWHPILIKYLLNYQKPTNNHHTYLKYDNRQRFWSNDWSSTFPAQSIGAIFQIK